jgi:hypothetical protein
VVQAGDEGSPMVNQSPDSEVSKAYAGMVEPLLMFAEHPHGTSDEKKDVID